MIRVAITFSLLLVAFPAVSQGMEQCPPDNDRSEWVVPDLNQECGTYDVVGSQTGLSSNMCHEICVHKNNEGCGDCLRKIRECQRQVHKLRMKAMEHNRKLRKCEAIFKQKPSPAQPKPARKNWGAETDAARQKAKTSAGKTKTQGDQMLQQEQDSVNSLAAQKAAEEAEAARIEAAKWECYGEWGNIYEGYKECQSACTNYYSFNYCSAECKESSHSGSEAKGKSCFKRP